MAPDYRGRDAVAPIVGPNVARGGENHRCARHASPNFNPSGIRGMATVRVSGRRVFLSAVALTASVGVGGATGNERARPMPGPTARAGLDAHALYTSQLTSILRRGDLGSPGEPVKIDATVRNLPGSLAQGAFEKARFRDSFIGRGHYLYIASAPIDQDGAGSSVVCVTDTHKISSIFRAVTVPDDTPFDPMKTRFRPDGFKTRFESVVRDMHTGQDIDLSGWNSAWGHCGNLLRQIGARYKLPELAPLFRGR